MNEATATKQEEKNILRQAGLRVTPQRLAILRLMRGSKAHPSPEMVYEELKPAYPGLSLNTVYLTLRALEKANLLRRVSMEENVYRYDANVAPHVHLVCRGCGRVDDFGGDMGELLVRLGRAVRESSAWEVQAQDSCFYGYCPGCREKRRQGPLRDASAQQVSGEVAPEKTPVNEREV